MKNAQTVTKTVEVENHADLLEQVVAQTVTKPEVPAGYQLLPAGVLRKVRVRKEWLADPALRGPWIVEGGGETLYCREVEFVTSPKCCSSPKKSGCGARPGSAWIETNGELLVKVAG